MINKEIISFLSLARSDNVEALEAQLNKIKQCGLDIDVVDEFGETALIKAAKAGALESFRFLLDNEADITKSGNNDFASIHHIIESDNFEMLELLVTKNPRVVNQTAKSWFPLHFAASCNSLKVLDLLLDSGAEINAKTAKGNSVAMIAVQSNNYKFVERLITKGADVSNINIDEIEDEKMKTLISSQRTKFGVSNLVRKPSAENLVSLNKRSLER